METCQFQQKKLFFAIKFYFLFFGFIKIGLFCETAVKTLFSRHASHMIHSQTLQPAETTSKKKTGSSRSVMFFNNL